MIVCVGGLGMLVASDELTDKDWPALNRAKGDIFMIVGATLYGFSMSPQLLSLFITESTDDFFTVTFSKRN